jgi:hypothetical protein
MKFIMFYIVGNVQYIGNIFFVICRLLTVSTVLYYEFPRRCELTIVTSYTRYINDTRMYISAIHISMPEAFE